MKTKTFRKALFVVGIVLAVLVAYEISLPRTNSLTSAATVTSGSVLPSIQTQR